jgi:hypothetical protein
MLIYFCLTLKANHENDLANHDAEVDRVRNEFKTLQADYQELYGVKVALDIEIKTYRTILETEEATMNITVGNSRLQSKKRKHE